MPRVRGTAWNIADRNRMRTTAMCRRPMTAQMPRVDDVLLEPPVHKDAPDAAAGEGGSKGGQLFEAKLTAQRSPCVGGMADAAAPAVEVAGAPAGRAAEGAGGGAGAPPVPAGAVERLLLGQGPQGAEVRLRIGQGPLAGTEIHLRQLPGGIEAVVLTRVECSRQTLAVAMAEVARRLQRKGY